MASARRHAAANSRQRADDVRSGRDRLRIAQAAARLIAEHGMSDWAAAKRKAARHLMLPERTVYPSNEEVEQALADYHALFRRDAHAATLRAQRKEALAWMHRLAAWRPVLVGGVAAGWAPAHSDIRLELVADDPKAVEMALAGEGIAYAALPAHEGDPTTSLRIETRVAAIRLAIVDSRHRRNRARDDDKPRLDAAALAALMASEPE